MECVGEEAAVPRRGQVLRSIEDLQESTGSCALSCLPGLPVLCPKAAGECPWALGFRKGSRIPEGSDLGALSTSLGAAHPTLDGFAFTCVLRVRPQSIEPNPTGCWTWYSLRLVLIPHQLRPTRSSLVGGGHCGSSKPVCGHLLLPTPEGRQEWRGWRESSVQGQNGLGEAALQWA